MLKNLLSTLTVMLLAFSMNASAQNIQKGKAVNNLKTAVIERQPGEFWDGYWDGSLNNLLRTGTGWGSSDSRCNTAICFPKGSSKVKGLSIEGIRFLLPGNDPSGIQNLKIWLSTNKSNKAENADIICQDVNIEDMRAYNWENPYNEIRFDTSYVCPADKDIYIGVSFNTTPNQSQDGWLYKDPFIFDESTTKIANSNWVLQGDPNGRIFWNDYNKDGLATIQVLLKGEAKNDIAVLSETLGSHTGAKGMQADVPFEIQNNGSNAINSVSIETDIDGVKTTIDAELDSPINNTGDIAIYNGKVNLPETTGWHNFSAKIVKVNGTNVSDVITSEGKMLVVSKAVEHKIFFEEFTFLTCGNCPRGIVAIEKLKKIYGDDIIFASVHIADPMKCKEYDKYSEALKKEGKELAAPLCNVDRTYNLIDPYFGSKHLLFGINDDILSIKKLPIAEIKASYSLKDSVITANSDIQFLYNINNANFAIGYLITEDSLYNEKWAQANFLCKEDQKGIAEQDPDFEPWTNGSINMTGIVFDDVVIAAKGIVNGIDNSIPATIEENVNIKHSETFDLRDYKIRSFEHNLNNLRVIAVIFDRTNGEIVNASSIRFSKQEDVPTGITEAENSSSAVAARYTIDGRRINEPQKGINIIRYADGTVKKVLVK